MRNYGPSSWQFRRQAQYNCLKSVLLANQITVILDVFKHKICKYLLLN